MMLRCDLKWVSSTFFRRSSELPPDASFARALIWERVNPSLLACSGAESPSLPGI